jgi:hypothetical protein
LAEGKCWEQHIEEREIDGVIKYVASEDVVGVLFDGEVGVWTALSDCSKYINNDPLDSFEIDRVTVDCYKMDFEQCQTYPECSAITTAPQYSQQVYDNNRYCRDSSAETLFIGCIRKMERDNTTQDLDMDLSHHTIFYNSKIDKYIETYKTDMFITEYSDRSPYLAEWKVDENATRDMLLYYQALEKEDEAYYSYMLECNSSKLKELEF